MSHGARCLSALFLALALTAALAPNGAAARPWTEVAAGARGEYRWSVSLGARQSGPGARSGAVQPCLLVSSSWRSEPLEWHRSSYRECASAPLRGAAPPLVATSVQTSGAAPAPISAVGMAFAAAVRRVRVTLAGGQQVTLTPRSTTRRPIGRPGYPLRYVAFTVRGEWCAERIVSVGVGGTVLWDSGSDEYVCGSDGAPQYLD